MLFVNQQHKAAGIMNRLHAMAARILKGHRLVIISKHAQPNNASLMTDLRTAHGKALT